MRSPRECLRRSLATFVCDLTGDKRSEQPLRSPRTSWGPLQPIAPSRNASSAFYAQDSVQASADSFFCPTRHARSATGRVIRAGAAGGRLRPRPALRIPAGLRAAARRRRHRFTAQRGGNQIVVVSAALPPAFCIAEPARLPAGCRTDLAGAKTPCCSCYPNSWPAKPPAAPLLALTSTKAFIGFREPQGHSGRRQDRLPHFRTGTAPRSGRSAVEARHRSW